MLTRAAGRGFTLVELLVTLTILGLMVALVMPSFATMMQNSRLGAAAKSYSLGVQTARAAAIRMNSPVQFVLTNTPIGPGIETSAVPATNGKNWVVRYVDPVSAAASAIEVHGAQESGGLVGTSPVEIAGAAVTPAAATFNGVLSFNGFGGTLDGSAVELKVTNAAGGSCAADGGPMRCQVIQVRPGGQINLCDPAAARGDSRACPAYPS